MSSSLWGCMRSMNYERVNESGRSPSPSGRGRRDSQRAGAPGEGRAKREPDRAKPQKKSFRILRPSPCPLPEGEGALTPVATTGIAVSKYGIHCIFPGGADRNNQGLAYVLTLLSLCTCDRFQHTHRADRLSGLRRDPPGRCHIPRYACRPGCICANGDVPAGNRHRCVSGGYPATRLPARSFSPKCSSPPAATPGHSRVPSAETGRTFKAGSGKRQSRIEPPSKRGRSLLGFARPDFRLDAQRKIRAKLGLSCTQGAAAARGRCESCARDGKDECRKPRSRETAIAEQSRRASSISSTNDDRRAGSRKLRRAADHVSCLGARAQARCAA